MGNRLKLTIAIWAAISLLLAGCYKEEHFDMPGTGEGIVIPTDSMPDPFDGSNTVYLIKDGTPDFSKMSVMGFTDFAVEMPAALDALSWKQGVDRNGNVYFGPRQHKILHALDNTDNYGGNPLSYMYNALQARVYLKNGPQKNWKITARMATEVMGRNSLSHFSFEGGKGWNDRSLLGFDWSSSVLYWARGSALMNSLLGINNYPMPDYITPCEPFEMVLCCVNNFFYMKVDGKTMWAFSVEDVPEQVFPLMFHPWMGAARFYDLSIEGDYVMQEAMAFQRENNYVNIQAPALADVNGTALLFAEGRHEVMMQTSSLTSVRSNATDIIMKRSSDGGKNWGEWTVLKGGDNGVYMRPEVINAGDKLYLFYTVDLNGKQDGDYRIEYLVSADGGVNWSQGQEVDVTLAGFTVSTLSGHGIKTSDGELVIPVKCQVGNRGTVAALFSQDAGTTWQIGNVIGGLRNNSASIFEQEGKLVMYITHSSSGNSRKIVTSTDGGVNWTEPVDATIPTGNGGQQVGGATVTGTNGTIYHFTPTATERTTSFSGSSISQDPVNGPKNQKRLYIYKPGIELIGNGMTMTVSKDGGQSWETKDLVNITCYENYIYPVGAMDAVISGNTVIVVTEGGTAVPYEGLLIFRETAN